MFSAIRRASSQVSRFIAEPMQVDKVIECE
jgi:hypothetical protein